MGPRPLIRCSLTAIAVLAALLCRSQTTVVHWAYGPFGTPGDPAYVVVDDRIYTAAGGYGQRGSCLYVVEDERVLHAADALGRPGGCAFLLEAGRLVRAQGRSCARGSCALVMEGDKVFRGEGAFCTRQEGAFFIERAAPPAPTVVYLAEGPFASKGDALFEIRGPISEAALLTLLSQF